MVMEHKYMVCTLCYTYNQSSYIGDTLQGMVIQKTDFPVVYVIDDDASTDGEQLVLQEWANKQFILDVPVEETEYGEIIRGCSKFNSNAFFVFLLLKENHYQTVKTQLKEEYIKEWELSSKYIAFCEGDDYWVDPLKLQKQVSYLEANPDYGLVYTNHYNKEGDCITQYKEKGYTSFDDIVLFGGIGTLTACLRMDLYQKYYEEINPRNKNWKMGDAPLWKYISYNSKIKFIPDYTAVYRILPTSASHFKDFEKEIAFIESGYNIQCFFIDKYVDNKTKHDSLMTIVNKNRINAIYGILYTNRKTDRLMEFMKDKWSVLDIKTRALYYLRYILLSLKGAKE